MAGEDWDADHPVAEEADSGEAPEAQAVPADVAEEVHPLLKTILAEAHSFQFSQLVRVLQFLHPDAVPIGHQGPAEKEIVRVHPDPSLGFHASDVARVNAVVGASDNEQFEIETTFLSLLGSQSPLPVHYTETVLQDDSDENLTKPFLDLFHHRLASLFYRVWEKYRYPMRFQHGGMDYYSQRLLSLVGLGGDIVPSAHRIPAIRCLAYAGLLTQMPHSASGMEGILNNYFPDVGIRVEGCAPQWIPISPAQQNRLGARNSTLGRDMTIGERVYDRSCTFRISVGPLDLKGFEAYLPPGDRTAELRELVDLFNSDNLDYYTDVWIRCEEIPELNLSGEAARLGWTTWLGERPGTDQHVGFLMKGWLHGRS